MMYFAVFLVLFVLELIYFKIADRFNIIDKPNHRSSHTKVTLRGGGIIFPIAFLLYFAVSILYRKDTFIPKEYWAFGLGLLILSMISFLDDILDLSTKFRLFFHFISVSLLIYFLGILFILPIWLLPIVFIFIIGVLNAYNFMDGINGMTGLYSLVTLGSLLYINQNFIAFTDKNFIIYPIIASLVFLFFNFRKKAKCFAGDVGSMSIAFWVLALLGLLIIKTQELKYLLFLTVYGVEVVLTILQRLKSKENIFEAHRRHLYQLFSNEKKISHLIVSSVYAFLQLLINITVILLDLPIWIIFVVIIIPSLILYIITKAKIEKQIKVINNN